MTDLQNFVALYKEMGIECEAYCLSKDLGYWLCLAAPSPDSHFQNSVRTYSSKLEGLEGCYTRIEFDANEKFMYQSFERD